MDTKRSQRYSILGLEGSEWYFYFMNSSDIHCENIEFHVNFVQKKLLNI